MEKITKKAVIQALKDLIKGYKEGNLYHSPATCSLCNVYMVGCSCPKECLNTVFGKPNIIDSTDYADWACVIRCHEYTRLDWTVGKNNPDLAKFWGEVLILIKASSPKDVRTYSDELRTKILEIASNYR